MGTSIVGNQLFLNLQGVTADNSIFPVSAIIDINSGAGGVPEPATWITVLTSGVGLLGFWSAAGQTRSLAKPTLSVYSR